MTANGNSSASPRNATGSSSQAALALVEYRTGVVRSAMACSGVREPTLAVSGEPPFGDHPVISQPASRRMWCERHVEHRRSHRLALLREEQHAEPDLDLGRVVELPAGSVDRVVDDRDVTVLPLVTRQPTLEQRPDELVRLLGVLARDSRRDEAPRDAPMSLLSSFVSLIFFGATKTCAGSFENVSL